MYKSNTSTVPNTKQAIDEQNAKRWADGWEGPLCAIPVAGDKNFTNIQLVYRKLQKVKPPESTPAEPTP